MGTEDAERVRMERWIYRFGADPKGRGREERRAAFHRAPFVSATGSALRSVPTVAPSSAQFNFILTRRNTSSEETARKKNTRRPLTPGTLSGMGVLLCLLLLCLSCLSRQIKPNRIQYVVQADGCWNNLLWLDFLNLMPFHLIPFSRSTTADREKDREKRTQFVLGTNCVPFSPCRRLGAGVGV